VISDDDDSMRSEVYGALHGAGGDAITKCSSRAYHHPQPSHLGPTLLLATIPVAEPTRLTCSRRVRQPTWSATADRISSLRKCRHTRQGCTRACSSGRWDVPLHSWNLIDDLCLATNIEAILAKGATSPITQAIFLWYARRGTGTCLTPSPPNHQLPYPGTSLHVIVSRAADLRAES
jgi:hypothetical protein